jgi:hypothetical protein
VEGGDISNPKHCWLVCRDCARRMDADPAFREMGRPAFEQFQRYLAEADRQP